MAHRYSLTAISLLVGSTLSAGEADVLEVKGICDSEYVCNFHVTVSHADAGWEHYADRWEIRTEDGKRIGMRTLEHPHDNEQPFTRTLNNVKVPDGVSVVVVRARDSRHKYGGKEITVTLTHNGSG
jgi:hypothetical protein